MNPLAIGVIAIALAYFWTGYNMAFANAHADPIDRPQYANGPTWRVMLLGLARPAIARANRELSWYMGSFVAAIVVYGCLFAALLRVLNSGFWPILVLGYSASLQ